MLCISFHCSSESFINLLISNVYTLSDFFKRFRIIQVLNIDGSSRGLSILFFTCNLPTIKLWLLFMSAPGYAFTLCRRKNLVLKIRNDHQEIVFFNLK